MAGAQCVPQGIILPIMDSIADDIGAETKIRASYVMDACLLANSVVRVVESIHIIMNVKGEIDYEPETI